MPTIGSITIEDYDGERTVTSFNMNNIGLVGATYESVAQDLDEVKDAVAAVITGVIRHVGLKVQFPEDEFSAVTDENAQRERKWLVVMRDTTQFLDLASAVANTGYGKYFTFEIGTADLQYLDAVAKDKMDIANAPGSTLVASLNANVRSPWNFDPELLHTVSQEVVEIRHVGRNI